MINDLPQPIVFILFLLEFIKLLSPFLLVLVYLELVSINKKLRRLAAVGSDDPLAK